MSVASLNIYHHGKHHPFPVPKWLGQLFFIFIPKLLFMNITLPINWQNRHDSLLKCMVNRREYLSNKFTFLFFFKSPTNQTYPLKLKTRKKSNKQLINKTTSFHNGKMTLYEDPIEREIPTGTSSLAYSENIHPYEFCTSPPLILRSYTSLQSTKQSTHSQQHHLHQQQQQAQAQAQQQQLQKENDLTNKTSKLSMSYIHRLIEQSERRYERQEQTTTICYEWQILSQVVDRLLVFLFLLSTIIVFVAIFFRAPLLRLK